MFNFILDALFVFSIVLILTKSKIFAGKREFVDLRYKAAKVNNQDPGLIHRWWHAIWHCSMCCGFWVAIIFCLFCKRNINHNWFTYTLALFGTNWLLHCVENVLFNAGKYFENFVDNGKNDV